MNFAQFQHGRRISLRYFALLIAAWWLVVAPTKVSADTAQTDLSAADKLLRLAQKQFTNDIAPSEEKLFRAAAKGEVADYQNRNKTVDNDPTNAVAWSTNRRIRADRLVWLCTDPDASELVSFRGIQITGARIDGTVDLGASNLSFPIKVTQSAFTSDLILICSHLPSLDLSGTHVRAVEAKWMKVDASIFLEAGSQLKEW
jgi:hypothetical protein